MSFKGKVAVVTGSSSGIGAATAIQFAKEGADVVITGRNEAKLKRVYDECAKHGKTPLLVLADVSNEAQAQSIIDKTIEKFGKIDILVNNAGYAEIGSILDGTILKSYDGIMATNMRPVVHLTMIAAPHLIKTKGNIVNISSTVSQAVYPAVVAYCTSKAALDHFTRGSALELSPHGVRVNAVNPGPVRTDFLENAGMSRGANYDMLAKNTLHQRVSEADEIADAILYLASDRARSITGAIHIIDNGQLLHSFTK